MSAGRNGVDLYRAAITLLLVVSLFVTLGWLQGRFNTSDHDKATQLVRSYRPQGGGIGIEEAILRRHPGRRSHDIRWESELRSSCLGHVRVRGTLPEASYVFDVNLSGPSVHPSDPITVEILESLTSSVAQSPGRRDQSLTP